MDDPALDVELHRGALRGLARINRWSNAGGPVWRAMKSIAAEAREVSEPQRPLRMLDLATGSGDVLVDIHRRAERDGIAMDVTACDISPIALDACRARLDAAGVCSHLFLADAAAGLPLADQAIDIAVCSLFLHHLTADQVVHILREMARVARLGIIAADLRRCRLGLVAAALVPRLLTRSPVVHVDAVRSVRAAWTPEELRALARESELQNVMLTTAWPFRMVLTARTTGSANATQK